MTIYVWHTGHEINERLSLALHSGIPNSILKHTEYKENYFSHTNKNIAVGYGILRGTGDIFKHNEAHSIDYYEVDRGYINPKHFDGYYRISKNGMQAKYVDKDLPSDRLDKLKIKRENWFNPKGKIIVCPPSEYIEHYYGLASNKWEDMVTSAISSITMRPFKVRHKSDTTPLEYDLQECFGVVTFNSNVAIDAVIKGLPVFTGYQSIFHEWGTNALEEFLDSCAPTNEQIDKLLRFISYNQFTLEEIRNGTAWRLLHE